MTPDATRFPVFPAPRFRSLLPFPVPLKSSPALTCAPRTLFCTGFVDPSPLTPRGTRAESNDRQKGYRALGATGRKTGRRPACTGIFYRGLGARNGHDSAHQRGAREWHCSKCCLPGPFHPCPDRAHTHTFRQPAVPPLLRTLHSSKPGDRRPRA